MTRDFAKIARVVSLSLVGLLVAYLTSCGEDSAGPPPGPDPGFLEVVLSTPNTDDGALLFTVRGGAIDSVTTVPGLTAFDAGLTATQKRVVVIGPVARGVIARIWVPDRREADRYLGAVEEASVRGTNRSRSPSGYAIQVRR